MFSLISLLKTLMLSLAVCSRTLKEADAVLLLSLCRLRNFADPVSSNEQEPTWRLIRRLASMPSESALDLKLSSDE